MVDVHKPGDFPIILGDSLKEDVETSSAHLGIKYNWTPKNDFEDCNGKLNRSTNGYDLSYEQGDAHHEYVGRLSEESDQNSQLALFYDPSKSAFVLERLAASFDFNLKSSSDLSTDQIRRHARIEGSKNNLESNVDHGERNELLDDPDEEAPDASNPFDYRHYLAEAKENADKASHNTLGGRTPMSGLSSPMPGATNHLRATTPQFAPTEIRPSKRKVEDPPQSRRNAATSAKPKTTRKAQSSTFKPKTSAPSKQSKPLSSEVVIDSDDSSDPSAPSPALDQRPSKSKTTKSQANNPFSSPPIATINDSLEIEEGSPPPNPSSKRRAKIDPNLFRSHTNTPTLTNNNRAPTSSAPHNNQDQDIEMADANDEDDESSKYLLPASSDEASQDGDIEDLILDEPEPEPLPAPKAKRRQSSTTSRRYSKPSSSVQDAHSHSMVVEDDEDEEDDGGLAAELEAALEREAQMNAGGANTSAGTGGSADDDDEGGVGLGIGIGMSGGNGADEESDISEEE